MSVGKRSRSRVQKPLLLALTVAASLAGASGCGGEGGEVSGKMQMFRSGPTFESVGQLRAESDVVVLGRVTGVFSREEDDGGNGTGHGIPLVFYNFEVERSLRGDLTEGSTIQIGWTDPDKVQTEQDGDLSTAGPVVLFADEFTHSNAPGLDTVDVSYFTLSGTNGVFSVDTNDHEVTAWSEVVRTLDNESDSGGESSGRRSWPEVQFMKAAAGGRPSGG